MLILEKFIFTFDVQISNNV